MSFIRKALKVGQQAVGKSSLFISSTTLNPVSLSFEIQFFMELYVLMSSESKKKFLEVGVFVSVCEIFIKANEQQKTAENSNMLFYAYITQRRYLIPFMKIGQIIRVPRQRKESECIAFEYLQAISKKIFLLHV